VSGGRKKKELSEKDPAALQGEDKKGSKKQKNTLTEGAPGKNWQNG